MKPLLRNSLTSLVCLLASSAWLQVYAQSAIHPISAYTQAKKHAIVYDKPAPNFFEGALLGNGGMGVVVTTRPDAVVLYFGHNNVWDIRIAEDFKDEIGTFAEVFEKVQQIPDTLEKLTDDPWYREYNKLTTANYAKPYPRPFPCGRVVLGFDRREATLLGHKLDIATGVCDVSLLTKDGKHLTLRVFTEMEHDRLWMRLLDAEGRDASNVFDRIRVIPDPSTPKEFPTYAVTEALTAGTLAFRQVLPRQEPADYNPSTGDPGERAFSLIAKTNVPLEKKPRINWDGNQEEMHELEAALGDGDELLICVALAEGLDSQLPARVEKLDVPSVEAASFRLAAEQATASWQQYWDKSGMRLADEFLECIWYRNLYFFNCAAKDGVTPPGLFANWSYNNIGTAWHGDYHMNYNTQQPFWMTFSSNHLEKNLPYVQLVENLMDVSRKWARDYYNLPGAYFPHSAYPVTMTMNPYPVPDWGWEICETPWTVQGLWWHYLYSGDVDFLKNRAYEPIKAAVEFLVAYIKRPEARGGDRWDDDRYHIFPTIPPELYSLRPGFAFNYDVNIDLALTKFIFNAFSQMVQVLGTQAEDGTIVESIRDILTNFPDYPMAKSPALGPIFVSVPGEHDKVVYNVPLPLTTVFPGEQHGLHTSPDTLQWLENTFRNQQNEGGNDLVFLNLQAARIGLLDLEQFKQQVNYSLLPNGTATDMVMQVHGRYSDQTNFDFMAGMGIWFENFGLPAVINECLMQSYTGTIELFPNWPMDKDAQFTTLRAVGAFLVSASLEGGQVRWVNVISEKGATLKIKSPWGKKGFIETAGKKWPITTELIELETTSAEEIILTLE
ncbi:glycosyl hydrolase family 95 catalytic domain-containing protein [Parapedobacter indicus]|uniref:Glycosyl hydrolase family 65, N-terminal domain n=1 Tax=Parapedobacter indicus TaxID=1477437 RepID=A0A1I3S076_9SPHI|nr:glycoside hydrolase N-terminal domain-containing protein [Parapedobacter indicus]PPK99926.1 glycosyl hydrolase family 65 [Parapedobacter indicus]SFJ51572.1 Glycosyl hydrolase family 65, N-terminal domain [Parapedobacter indicus]